LIVSDALGMKYQGKRIIIPVIIIAIIINQSIDNKN